MNKKIKQIIGAVLVVYGLAQIIGGALGTPIIPNNDVVTMWLGSPIATIGFIVVGLLLIFEKKK